MLREVRLPHRGQRNRSGVPSCQAMSGQSSGSPGRRDRLWRSVMPVVLGMNAVARSRAATFNDGSGGLGRKGAMRLNWLPNQGNDVFRRSCAGRRAPDAHKRWPSSGSAQARRLRFPVLLLVIATRSVNLVVPSLSAAGCGRWADRVRAQCFTRGLGCVDCSLTLAPRFRGDLWDPIMGLRSPSTGASHRRIDPAATCCG